VLGAGGVSFRFWFSFSSFVLTMYGARERVAEVTAEKMIACLPPQPPPSLALRRAGQPLPIRGVCGVSFEPEGSLNRSNRENEDLSDERIACSRFALARQARRLPYFSEIEGSGGDVDDIEGFEIERGFVGALKGAL
jgi:hypothetical protein